MHHLANQTAEACAVIDCAHMKCLRRVRNICGLVTLALSAASFPLRCLIERRLMQVLGTDELDGYLQKYGIELDSQLEELVGRHSRKPWTKFINGDNQHLVSSEALDFLDKLLRYDHQVNFSAHSCLQSHMSSALPLSITSHLFQTNAYRAEGLQFLFTSQVKCTGWEKARSAVMGVRPCTGEDDS